MTPYIIIATANTYMGNGIHTMVSNHTIKTSMESCGEWVNLIADMHNCTNLAKKYESEDGRLTIYVAKSHEGWMEFEIWRESDIEL